MRKDTTPATKADLEALESGLKLHFEVVAEKLTGDFRGIFNYRTVDLSNARKDHEGRIERLERTVGIYS